MPIQSFDYIRLINAVSEELLQSHGDLLARKNIRRKHELIQLIKLDLDKLAHALIEVRETRAAAVIKGFFAESGLDDSDISGRLVDERIYHVGFEIHEPLDLVVYGIKHWIERSRAALGAEMRITKLHRFPASAAFQKRVDAFAEIMRIWLQVDDWQLMLELFDIHRPAETAITGCKPKTTHRNFDGLFRPEGHALGHKERLSQLFTTDEIWHYAFYVKEPADVRDLHGKLQILCSQRAGYSLPYSAPVHNQDDGSFHTKIVRQARGREDRLELEFVTQYSFGQNQC